MFYLYTLPLARPAEAKIQMLTTSSRIVTILLKSLRLKSFVIVAEKFGGRFILLISNKPEILLSTRYPLIIPNPLVNFLFLT